MKTIKKNLLQLLTKYTRWNYLRKSINIKAKYLIEEDRIIGIINNKSLKKRNKKTSMYKFDAHNMRLSSKIKEASNLNKPIEYVIENMEFEKAVKLDALTSNAKFSFKNCTFTKQIAISYADTIILENNEYYDGYDVYFQGESFLDVSGYVDNLKFVNDNFVNNTEISNLNSFKPHFGIHAKHIGRLEIINSNIQTSDFGTINLEKVNELIGTKDSAMSAPKIYINVDKIENPNITLKATKEIIIDNKEYNRVYNVTSPVIVYNGIDLSYPSSPKKIDEEEIKLHQTRQELIRTLRKYSNLYKDYLNNQILPQITVDSIHKTLKRKN